MIRWFPPIFAVLLLFINVQSIWGDALFIIVSFATALSCDLSAQGKRVGEFFVVLMLFGFYWTGMFNIQGAWYAPIVVLIVAAFGYHREWQKQLLE